MLNDNWIVAISGWVDSLRAGGAPETTIRTRREHLERAARATRWVSPGEVSARELVGYFAAQSWATETRRGHRASHRAFWQWCQDAGITSDNPASLLPMVKAAEGFARPTPDEAYTAALARASERVGFILRLAAEAGLRRGEIAQIHARDIIRDLHGVSIIVHGKGGRRRVVPLPPRLGVEVEAACKRTGYLFPGGYRGHLTPRYIGQLAARALPDEWTLHTLRHRFATRAYGVDRDVFTVQALLGHVSPATTRRYVALDTSRLRVTVEAIAA